MGNRILQSRILLPFARILLLVAATATFVVGAVAFFFGVLSFAQSVPPRPVPPGPQPELNVGEIVAAFDFNGALEVEFYAQRRTSLRISEPLAVAYSVDEFDPIKLLEIVEEEDWDKVRTSNSPIIDEETSLTKHFIYPSASMAADLRSDPALEKRYSVLLRAHLSGGRTIERRIEFVFPALLRRPDSEPDTVRPPTNAENAAQSLALIVDPARTPLFFDAYTKALRRIERCDADSEAYAARLSAALKEHAARLARHNAFRFAGDVCEAWKNAKEQAEKAHRIRLNAYTDQVARAAAAKVVGLAALGFAGIALLAFLGVAHMLALHAIENHLRDMKVDQARDV